MESNKCNSLSTDGQLIDWVECKLCEQHVPDEDSVYVRGTGAVCNECVVDPTGQPIGGRYAALDFRPAEAVHYQDGYYYTDEGLEYRDLVIESGLDFTNTESNDSEDRG